MSGGNDEPNSIAFFLSLALITVAAGFVAATVSEMLRDGLEALSAGSFGFFFGDQGIASIDQVVGIINQSLASVSEALTQFAADVPNFVIMLLIYLYSLYFFLLDGRALLRQASSAIPLRRNEKQEFGITFMRVSRATLKGTFVIGGILFFTGETGKALLMIILGGGLIAGVDYLVRPLIIRGDAQFHQGIALFGLVGLLLGPIIMALFVAIWKTFRGRYKGELRDVASGKT